MSRPAVPVVLEVIWTQTAATAAIKAAQVQARRIPIPSRPLKVRVMEAIRRTYRPGVQFTQRAVAEDLDCTTQGVYKVFKELTAEGLIVEIDTKNCTRNGARFVYELSDRVKHVD